MNKIKLDILAGELAFSLDILAGAGDFLLSFSDNLLKCPEFSPNKGMTTPCCHGTTYLFIEQVRNNLQLQLQEPGTSSRSQEPPPGFILELRRYSTFGWLILSFLIGKCWIRT